MQIEINVRITNSEKVTDGIKQLGAKFWKKTLEKDTYFHSKKGTFSLKESKNGEVLLIHDFRSEDNPTITLRTELPLDNIFAEKLSFILDDTIGKKIILEREREQYLLHGILLAINSIKNHETFLELTSDEIQEREKEVEKKKLFDLLHLLGFAEKDLETKSYVDLYV